MAYIELKDVDYVYPLAKEPALKNVTASFERGKFYGVIGENAGGKTTLCNLLRGLIPHFYKGKLTGEVLIDGEDIRTLNMDVLTIKNLKKSFGSKEVLRGFDLSVSEHCILGFIGRNGA